MSVEVIDWPSAATIAGRLARPGPDATRPQREALVDGLRAAARRAVPAVLDVTGMRPAPESEATSDRLSEVLVVDRPGWARANARVMSAMTQGLGDGLTEAERAGLARPAVAVMGAVEVGGVLAALSSRVLGQFDPYGQAGLGRLLLVAPNVLSVERALRVRARDFRLWVCLHEQTHALQFAAAPWLAEHLRARTHSLLGSVTEGARTGAGAPVSQRLRTAGRAVVGVARGQGVTGGIMTPEQQDELSEITAVMALLEGHADVMMDAVGPSIVPTVAAIRRRFEQRRDGAGQSPVDSILRRVLGMDAKLAQYRDGARFVRGVEAVVGRDRLNTVWTSVETLPTAAEIRDPDAWVRRVRP
ncbi:zinc-dependent metalloprotease [Paraoerskovia marina]|uniref:zinc-dependent metalloprotease n=1 Tax=Paraoerskovia marina TaxID=545619 RepID=UPI000B2E518A|nr:zinc-dependent metalloprotease [Paraoerskovia marina]